ncbi:hypothetical protein [Salinimicrobium sp. WS361]|uniref:hypothetical protein n=1 Tax=Salinimicrobium sp. WS361 TaxID=3425123 RepID=UPI003D6E78BE
MARITYLEILEGLEKYWTAKEIQNFNSLTKENLFQITSGKILHPVIFPQSHIRKILIHPNVTLFYKINEIKNSVVLITFFKNRMDPETLKKLLNI